MKRQDTLHPGPRRPSLSKSPSAPELPPIERSKRTPTGSGPTGTGSLRASSGSAASWDLPGRQRSSSLPTVSNDNGRLSNARANASYTKKAGGVGGGGGAGVGREGRGRRVSLIAEDPQNEVSSPAAPPCSPRASPLASRRRASEQMTSTSSTQFPNPGLERLTGGGPFHDPEWQDYLRNAKRSKMKPITSINTYNLYNLDPKNIAKTMLQRCDTPPRGQRNQETTSPDMSHNINPRDTSHNINPRDTAHKVNHLDKSHKVNPSDMNHKVNPQSPKANKNFTRKTKTPPLLRKSQPQEQVQISQDTIEDMVNPVDTDFRIIKWIQECEEAEREDDTKNNRYKYKT